MAIGEARHCADPSTGTFPWRTRSIRGVTIGIPPSAVNERSFDDVYRSARPGLMRLAFLIVGSGAVAEELVQEAFLRLHQRFAAVDNPDAYLRVVVVRLCTDANRRRAVELDQLARMSEPPVTAPHAIDEVWDAIQRLSWERRAVLVLRYYEDLPHGDIARILGCPVVTVRTRVRRALADLRKELDK
jgi:RNA polymerase sigma factor (sigma-70 family)